MAGNKQRQIGSGKTPSDRELLVTGEGAVVGRAIKGETNPQAGVVEFETLTAKLGMPLDTAHPSLMGMEVDETAKSGGLYSAVKRGLPYSTFENLRSVTGLKRQDLAGIAKIPLRTLDRRKESGHLDPEESDRTARISRVFGAALELFEYNREEAARWMNRERRALGGETPWQMTSAEAGAREVEALINRIEHGVHT